jgi:hypothetical protein
MPKTKKPEPRMVAVLAKDWSHSTECVPMDHAQMPMPAWCVGMLTYEGKDFIELSQLHFYRDKTKRVLLSLTKESIVRMYELKKKKELKIKKSMFSEW